MSKPAWALSPSRVERAITGSVSLYTVLLVGVPLIALVHAGFAEGISAFIEGLKSPVAQHALWLTLWTAGLVSAINIVFGTAAAWVLVRYPLPGKNAISALVDLPFAVPTLVAGVMIGLLYGRDSFIQGVFQPFGIELIYAAPGIVIALLFVTLPFVIRAVEPVLLEIDPAEEEAARVLGAGPLKTFLTVHYPAIAPAALSGAIRGLGRAVGELGSVIVIAGNIPMRTLTASVFVLGEIERDERVSAAAVSIVLLALAIALHAVARQLELRAGLAVADAQPIGNSPQAAAAIAAPPLQVRRVARKRWDSLRIGRAALLTTVLGYIAIVLLAPLIALGVELGKLGLGAAFEALRSPEAVDALVMSLVLTALAVVINGIVGVPLAIALTRQRFFGHGVINALVDLPLAISPVMIGLAFIALVGRGSFLQAPLEALGITVLFSFNGLLVATLFVTLPFTVREVAYVLEEIGTNEEEAAATLGASPLQTFMRVTLPNIRVGLGYGLLMTAARSLGEFGAVLVLGGSISQHTQTATTYIHQAIEEREPAGAYGMALVLGLLSAGLWVALERLKKARH